MTHLKRVSCLNDVDHTAIVIWLLKEKKKKKIHPMKIYTVF